MYFRFSLLNREVAVSHRENDRYNETPNALNNKPKVRNKLLV